MWWAEFEVQMNFAFHAYEKKERRVVHSNEMKLRYLTKKIKADFLNSTKSAINVSLTAVPMVMTYEQAMKAFRLAVAAKFPPEITATKVTRRINELGSRGGGRGRQSGRGRGRGRDGGRGRGRGRRNEGNSYHADQYPVRLKNGKVVNVHSSFYIDGRTWAQLPDEAQKRLLTERAQYKRAKLDRSIASMSTDCFLNPILLPQPSHPSISSASTYQYHPHQPPQSIQIQGTNSAQLPPPPPQGAPIPPPPPPPQDNVSTISQTSSIMGGRNEQASRSGRHFQDRRPFIGAVASTRRDIKTTSTGVNKIFKASPANTQAWNETDFNTDTCKFLCLTIYTTYC